jgi:hypothetical protein
MSTSQKYIIVKDRVEVYKDFALNLLYYIIDFYLGRETLAADQDIRNYFNWCYKRVCDEFKEEDLDFSTNRVLKDYFYQFYYHQFFKLKFENSNHDDSLEFYEKFWRNIFEIDKQKNKNVINTLIEVYNIFDISINQEKNILEIV